MSLGPEVTFFVDLLAIYSIYLIINTSLNLEFGYAGIPNFGKVLAVGVGAFVAAAVPGRMLAGMAGIGGDYIGDNIAIMSQVNAWLLDNTGAGIAAFAVTLAVAAAVGAAIGLLTAYPAIRLRGDYLAITLLAFGEGMRVIGINYTEIAGGTLGVQLPDPLVWLPPDLRFPAATVGLVIMAAAAVIYGDRLVRSPLGR
ncbi:MAG: branched-chain amino acid ABC transporter permease, partial [Thaumarchaeota archaeon]|nr:branched-chain amino acid ABC transporter permease [Nitrososphaerota archaeon]